MSKRLEPIGPVEQTGNWLTGPNPADPHRFPPRFYSHRTAATVPINETPARDAVQSHHIAEWTLAPDEDIRLFNLGTTTEPRMVKINRYLPPDLTMAAEDLLHEFKDIFAWSYQDLQGAPAKICQHRIELKLDAIPSHQRRYRMNPNYADVVKKDLDKLLAAGFIYPTEAATWLSPIVVVPKKNGKLRICIDYRKLNAQTMKDPYPLTYMDTILDEVAGHEMYSFMDGFLGYNQIKLAPEARKKWPLSPNGGHLHTM